jgi:hypothetical protein
MYTGTPNYNQQTTSLTEGQLMQFLKLNLINKHGVSEHQGEVLIAPSQIESIRSFIHTEHIHTHHEVGSIVTTKTGDKHYVSQHVDEFMEMLQLISEREESSVNPRWMTSQTAM